ncbi:uncharacterized protein LOC130823263 [Amaranthus tricolor]|uniref:uncharacterized protein LOC130823263 n=1 Tax=Amaranthus tricolor TaxID=29722 RepID=UPI0025832F39|nr:uncharacterized protein LOC130823263 [Amaranthus tricolor]
MRQRRWLELINDYDLEFNYHEAWELESRLAALSIRPSIFEEIFTNQVSDSLLEKTREQVKERKAEGFTIFEDGRVRYKGRWCVPSTCTELKDKILTEAHISKYSKVKSEHKRPAGLPRTRSGNDTLWVIVDRLTKSARFIPINNQWGMDQLAQAYLKHVIRYQGVPRSIVSDRDTRYVLKFWEAFQAALGTELLRSTSFHPATDGQTERTNRTLEDILRAVALDRQESWDECLDMVEFSYNNSYQTSIQMAPFEALYGRRCRPAMLEEMTDQVKMIQERLKAAQDRQNSYTDLKRRPDEFAVGDYLKRYVPDKSHMLDLEPLDLDENLSYEEKPIEILDSKDATWETEDSMREKYPHLFPEFRMYVRKSTSFVVVKTDTLTLEARSVLELMI